MSLCTKMMQVYCCFVFLFIFNFLQSCFLLQLCQNIALFFLYVYCIHEWEFAHQLLYALLTFTIDWISCPAIPTVTLALYFCAGTIFRQQSLIDDCSYEMKIQTIFSFHVSNCHWHFFFHFLFSFVVCYFQHYTTRCHNASISLYWWI